MDLDSYSKENSVAITNFNELLKDKFVGTTSSYQKLLPKLLNESRYKEVPVQYRKPLFDIYVKSLTGNTSLDKSEKKKMNAEYIKQLLNEYDSIDGFRKKGSYEEFKKFFGSDKRLVESMQTHDVEKYFNAKLEVIQQKFKNEKAKFKFRFSEMVTEFLDKEKRISKEIKWRDFKKKLKNDERYDLVSSSTERERIFYNLLDDYIKKYSKKGRRRSKSREEERKDFKFNDNMDKNQRISKMKDFEAVQNFKVMLAEKIKSYDYNYNEVSSKLSNDPRFASKNLHEDEKRHIFQEFRTQKRNDAITSFKVLLKEVIYNLTPITPLKEALSFMEQDIRFKNMAHEDIVEQYFDFQNQYKDETIENFQRYLLECPQVNGFTNMEGEEYDELIEKLSIDVRFRRMDFDTQLRDELIQQRIEQRKSENKKKYGDAEGVFEDDQVAEDKFKTLLDKL